MKRTRLRPSFVVVRFMDDLRKPTLTHETAFGGRWLPSGYHA